MGRRRRARADHRICQFGRLRGDRVPEGGAGIWNRVQDLYHCRAGDLVWDFYQLGAGSGLLDRKVFWGIIRKIRNRYKKRIYGQADVIKEFVSLLFCFGMN